MTVFGYARVSSEDQDLSAQREALEAAGCDMIREEKASGKDFVAVTTIHYTFSTAVSEEAASDEQWGPQEEDEPSIAEPSHG